MKLLRDAELTANLTGQAAQSYVTKADGQTIDNRIINDTAESMVQGCSVDLHIGDIYLPGKKEDEPGGVKQPKPDHVLRTGETAVIATAEMVSLPNNIAGIGFPPSKDVSGRGLLMTNPGHVDPGYKGTLRFTVINMGREDFALARGHRIVTLLLFQMDDAARAGWCTRNPGPSAPISQATVNRLSADFVDVTDRAKAIAGKAVDDAQLKVRELEVRLQKIAAVVGSALAFLGLFVAPWISGMFSRSAEVDSLKNRVSIVESRTSVDSKIQDLDGRLKALECKQVEAKCK